ncbi:MAG TPA: hypothetical protein VN982_10770 [Candidatus Dormibacteraeota bacterium]|nr:hypothetical protein [Candidatus Dormibacteraeota bacterium]
MTDTSIYAPLMQPSNPMEQTNNFLDTASRAEPLADSGACRST